MNDPGREHSRNSPKDHDNFSLSNSTSKRSRPVHAIRRVGHIKLAPIIYRPTCTRWITWSVLRQPPSLPKVVYSWYPFKAGSTWEPWSTLLFSSSLLHMLNMTRSLHLEQQSSTHILLLDQSGFDESCGHYQADTLACRDWLLPGPTPWIWWMPWASSLIWMLYYSLLILIFYWIHITDRSSRYGPRECNPFASAATPPPFFSSHLLSTQFRLGRPKIGSQVIFFFIVLYRKLRNTIRHPGLPSASLSTLPNLWSSLLPRGESRSVAQAP